MDTNNRDRMYGQPQNGMVHGQGQMGWNQGQYGSQGNAGQGYGSQYGQSNQGPQFGQSYGGQSGMGQGYGGSQYGQGYSGPGNIGSSQMYGGSSQGNVSSGYQSYGGQQGNLGTDQSYQGQGGYAQQGFGHSGQSHGEGGQHQGRFDSAQRGGAPSFDNVQRGGAPSFEQGRQGQFGREHHQGYQGQGQRGNWHREPLTAREVMTQDVKTVTRQTPLKDVAKLMKDENVGIIPVVDEQQKLLGVVTDRDIVTRLLAQGKDINTSRAEEVMTDDVEAVTPDENVHDVLAVMADKQVRRVPVVDKNDRLLGIIALADLASRADYDEELQHTLAKISAKRSFWSRLFG